MTESKSELFTGDTSERVIHQDRGDHDHKNITAAGDVGGGSNTGLYIKLFPSSVGIVVQACHTFELVVNNFHPVGTRTDFPFELTSDPHPMQIIKLSQQNSDL